MFSRWRFNSKFSKFYKLRNSIARDILVAIPDYSHALLCINKLALEAMCIQFLPINDPVKRENDEDEISDSPQPPLTYNLDAFMDIVYKLNVKSVELLQRFFIYVKYIVNEIREAYFERLRFYQKVLNQDDAALVLNLFYIFKSVFFFLNF